MTVFARAFTQAAPSALALPAKSSPYLSLNSPLTRASLERLRTVLADDTSRREAQERRILEGNTLEKHAGVLLPLCNVNDTPGILFEVRGQLRHHSGEVSFPGGKVDESDSDFLDAALRETHEEIGVARDKVTVLGSLGSPTTSLSSLRVWPFVGFLAPAGALPETDEPLPNLQMSDLIVSREEVAQVFHLPLTALVAENRLNSSLFRGQIPYWCVDVSDIAFPNRQTKSWPSDPEKRDEIGSGRDGRLEIWGLTAWYLNMFMRAIKLLD